MKIKNSQKKKKFFLSTIFTLAAAQAFAA